MSSVSMAAALGSDMFSLQEFSCNLCGASDSRTILESTIVSNNEVTPSDLNCTNFGHGEHFRVVECKKCSMRYCSPRPTFEALIRAYSGGEDSSYVDQEGGRKRTFARALKTVGGGPGKLLDVGCNTGVFLEEAQKKGFECFGIEPSHYAAKRAREQKKLNVFAGAVPCELPWKEPFDVITLWDVLEHLDDPKGTLQFLHSKLRSGGHLHLSTMDVESFYATVCGSQWPWFMKMHIQYFSKKTVREMLLKVGFKRVTITQYCHIVHKSYLLSKLQCFSLPLRLLGTLGATLLADSDGYVKVNMGDMMHVDAEA